MKNWLMWLQRLRNPMIFLLSAWTRKACWCNLVCVWHPKNQEHQCGGQQMDVPVHTESTFISLLPFCCTQKDFSGLDDAHMYWWWWTSLFGLPSANLFQKDTDTFRNNVLPTSWPSLSPVKLTCKVDHHLHFEVPEVRMWSYEFWEDTIQPITIPLGKANLRK